MSVKHNLRITTSVNRNLGGKTVLKQAMETKGLIGKRQAKRLGVENAAALNKAIRETHKKIYDVNDPNAAKAMLAPISTTLTRLKQANARAIMAIEGRGKNKKDYEQLTKSQQKEIDKLRKERMGLDEFGKVLSDNARTAVTMGKHGKDPSLSPRHTRNLRTIQMRLSRLNDGQSVDKDGNIIVPSGTLAVEISHKIRPAGSKKAKDKLVGRVDGGQKTLDAMQAMGGMLTRYKNGTLKMDASNSRKFNKLLDTIMMTAPDTLMGQIRKVRTQLGLVNKKGLKPRERARERAKLNQQLESLLNKVDSKTGAATQTIRTSKPKSAASGEKTPIKLGKGAPESVETPATQPEKKAPEKSKEVAKPEPIASPEQATKSNKPLTKAQMRKVAKEELRSGLTKVSDKDIAATIEKSQRDVIEDWTKNTEAKLKEVFKDPAAAEQFHARREAIGKASASNVPAKAAEGKQGSKVQVTQEGNVKRIQTSKAQSGKDATYLDSQESARNRRLQERHTDSQRAYKTFSDPVALQKTVDKVKAYMDTLKDKLAKKEISKEKYDQYMKDQFDVLTSMSTSKAGMGSWTGGMPLVDTKTFKLNPQAVEKARKRSEHFAVATHGQLMMAGVSPKLDTFESTETDIRKEGARERAVANSQAFIPRAVLNSMYTDIVTLGTGMGRSIKGGKDKVSEKQTRSTMALLGRVIAGHIDKISKLKAGDIEGFRKLKESALDGRVKDFYEAVEKTYTTLNSPQFDVPKPAAKEKAPKKSKTTKTETSKKATKKKAPTK